jgi:hypothetical protein
LSWDFKSLPTLAVSSRKRPGCHLQGLGKAARISVKGKIDKDEGIAVIRLPVCFIHIEAESKLKQTITRYE